MREVSTCDFCGDRAEGVFQVLPPEVDGGKRMLLCHDCRDTLASVVNPLLESRADVEPDASPATTDESETGESDTVTADPSSDAESATSTAGSDGQSTAESAGRSDGRMAATGAGTSSNVPRGYRKVVRFLENRELPIQRSEAVSMVVDAYGLDTEAVEAALDHAIKHGRFKDLDGELKKP